MTRVVVVGSGIAGITAALHAQHAGAEVVLVTKGALEESKHPLRPGRHRGRARGGRQPGRTREDTHVAAAGLADPAAVMCS